MLNYLCIWTKEVNNEDFQVLRIIVRIPLCRSLPENHISLLQEVLIFNCLDFQQGHQWGKMLLNFSLIHHVVLILIYHMLMITTFISLGWQILMKFTCEVSDLHFCFHHIIETPPIPHLTLFFHVMIFLSADPDTQGKQNFARPGKDCEC